jgi:hypothetical protein
MADGISAKVLRVLSIQSISRYRQRQRLVAGGVSSQFGATIFVQ